MSNKRQYENKYNVVDEFGKFFVFVGDNGKKGLLNQDFELCREADIDDMYISDYGYAVIFKNKKMGIYNQDMIELFPIKYDGFIYLGENAGLVTLLGDMLYVDFKSKKEILYDIKNDKVRKKVCNMLLDGYVKPVEDNEKEDRLWNIIAKTKKKANFSTMSQIKEFETLFKDLSQDELNELAEIWADIFNRYYNNPAFRMLHKSYGGVCPGHDDTFSDFIHWTIAQGKELYSKFFKASDYGVVFEYIKNNEIESYDYACEGLAYIFETVDW